MTRLVTFREADELGLWGDLGTHKNITCVNHPTARYISKDPRVRNLFFVRPADEAELEGWPGRECPCPVSDLRVVLDDPAT